MIGIEKINNGFILTLGHGAKIFCRHEIELLQKVLCQLKNCNEAGFRITKDNNVYLKRTYRVEVTDGVEEATEREVAEYF